MLTPPPESVQLALIALVPTMATLAFGVYQYRTGQAAAAKLAQVTALAATTHAIVTAKLDPTGVIARSVVTPGEDAPEPTVMVEGMT